MGYYDYDWPRYVSAAERRRKAERELTRLRKQGRSLAPVTVAGSRIAATWWGKAWCDNLERYSDYSNRMPRGRTYVRNGAVVDLEIKSGAIRALVSGTSLYEVDVRIQPLAAARWKAVVEQCSGQIGSLVELLLGQMPHQVMEILTRSGHGLFPAPHEIKLSCSCPDWATMCKHVAAALYGVGARLDNEPELFFVLRNVDQMDLVPGASAATAPREDAKLLDASNLPALFGIEIDEGPAQRRTAPEPSAPRAERASKRPRRKRAKGLSALIRREVSRVLQQRTTKAAKVIRKRPRR